VGKRQHDSTLANISKAQNSRGLALNRRQFVIGAAALAAAGSLFGRGAATAAADRQDLLKLKLKTTLAFSWNAELLELTVDERIAQDPASLDHFRALSDRLAVIVESKESGEIFPGSEEVVDEEKAKSLIKLLRDYAATWTIDLKPLDPSPHVSLRNVPDKPGVKHEIIIVCNGRSTAAIAHGLATSVPRQIKLRFQENENGTWAVHLLSDYWSAARVFKPYGALAFHDLVISSAAGQAGEASAAAPGPRFSCAANPEKDINRSLKELVGQEVEVSGKMVVSCSAQLLWSIAGDGAGHMKVFGGQGTTQGLFKLAWDEAKPASRWEGDEPLPVKAFSMRARVTPPPSGIVIGDTAGLHATLVPMEATDNRTDCPEMMCAEISRSEKVNSAQTTLSVPSNRWLFEILQGPEVAVGALTAKGKIIRRHIQEKEDPKPYIQIQAGLTLLGPYEPDKLTVTDTGADPKAATVTRSFALSTPAGRIRILPSAPQPKSADAGDPEERQEVLIQASLADDKAAPVVNRIHIVCSLAGLPHALPDASLSELSFPQPASLSLLYDQYDVALPASYIWLDRKPPRTGPAARFDLTRAELKAMNYVELLSLKFRFVDLALVLASLVPNEKSLGSTNHPVIAALPQECRVLAGPGADALLDTRPRLIVEFPPQHVFEEAIFRPQTPDPPRLDMGELSNPKIEKPELLALRILGTSRAEKLKAKNDWLTNVFSHFPAEPSSGAESFRKFATRFGDLNKADLSSLPDKEAVLAAYNALPAEQKVYTGPFGLEPDAMGVARQLAAWDLVVKQHSFVNEWVTEVLALRHKLIARDDSLASDREKLERALEAENSIYALFRDHYRARQLGLTLQKDRTNAAPPQEPQTYWLPLHDDDAERDLCLATFEGGERSFLNALMGKDPIPDVVRARLSNPSRLVFAVDCGPNTHVAQDLSEFEKSVPIAYSLAGLTEWSRHELVVVRRAHSLEVPDSHGMLGAPSKRIANIDDADILLFQGIKPGSFTTTPERLGQIGSILATPPGLAETAIEIPARLVLSPNQSAKWRVPHDLSRLPLFCEDMPQADAEKGIGPIAEELEPLRPTTGAGPFPLWAASLDIASTEPSATGLRAVYSPDFRPGALLGKFIESWPVAAGHTRTIGYLPPPKGPLAPWYLGRETTDSQDLSPSAAYTEYLMALGKTDPDPDSDICKIIDEPNGTKKTQLSIDSWPKLFRYLCGRRPKADAATAARLFRSSLDAYDRHELVILSSAYGLPVQGRRDAANALLDDADQFEAPLGFDLPGIREDSAIYRPRPLHVQELTLTALGGNFRHDTGFQPPAAARNLLDQGVYDSLSIERWQHWAVLGRDVLVEVVYKGFLFPLGLRVSLVKLTERTFMRNGKGAVKAYLRQRMFLRCANPDKAFPAMRQPNGGRQFPCRLLRLLTTTTPDIVDPSSPSSGLTKTEHFKVFPNGRFAPAEGGPEFAGRIFWPRTALGEANNLRFDFSVDGRKTTMPLIFVDNTAANDSGLMGKLVAYYNALPNPHAAGPFKDPPAKPTSAHLRTAAFGGQALRYCEELKSNDSTYETDFWTLKAQGRLQPLSTLEGNTTDYRIDAQMQGVDQPPFYPAVESVVLRVKQLERFSGTQGQPVLAQFDGGYVEAGFASQSDPRAAKNGMDVFLNFARSHPFGMGQQGDRSGGIYSPGSDVIALSRSHGPMGGAEDRTVKEIGKLEDWSRTDFGFAPPVRTPEPVAPATPGTPTIAPDKLKVFEKSFNVNAKLLGVIRLSDLIKFLGNDSNPTDIPVLQEVFEFGASAMHGVDKAAGSITDFLRREVLQPLLTIITGLEKIWEEVQREYDKARGSIGEKSSVMSLSALFPEIGSGLQELHKAVTAAIKTDGAIAFAVQLSAVHEAGQQLIDGLERLAANPIGRVKDGLQALLNGYTGFLQEQVAIIGSLAEDTIKKLQSDLTGTVAETVSDVLAKAVGGITGDMWAEQVFGAKPWDGLSDPVKTAAQAFAASVANALDKDHRKETFTLAAKAALLKWTNADATAELKALDEKTTAIKNAAKALHDAIEAEVGNASDELKRRYEALLWKIALVEATAQDIVDKAKAAGERPPQGLLALVDLLGMASPYMPVAAREPVAQVMASLTAAAGLMEALEKKDVQAIASQGLQVLGPLIGPYSGVDLENATAPLVEAYDTYLSYQKRIAVALLDASGSSGAALSSLVEQIRGELYDTGRFLETCVNLQDKVKKHKDDIPVEHQPKLNSFLDAVGNFITALDAQKAGWQAIALDLKREETLVKALAEKVANNGAAQMKLWEIIKGTAAGGLTLDDVRQLLEVRRSILRRLATEAKGTIDSTFGLLKSQATVIAAAAAVAAVAASVPDLQEFFNNNEEEIARQAASAGTKLLALIDKGMGAGLACTGLARQGQQLAADAISEADDVLVNLAARFQHLPPGLLAATRALRDGISSQRAELADLSKALLNFQTAVKGFTDFQGVENLAACGDACKALKALLDEHGNKIAQAAKPLGTSGDAGEIAKAALAKVPAQAEAAVQSILESVKAHVTATANKTTVDLFVAITKEATIGELKWPGLAQLYRRLIAGRKEIETALDANVPAILASKLRKLLLLPEKQGGPDKLADDLSFLEKVETGTAVEPGTAHEASFRLFVREWMDGTAAPLLILNNGKNILREIMRGEIFKLIDVSAIRDEIERAIRQLVPLRATLSYSFGGPFRDPKGIADITGGIFAPEEKSGLTIESQIKVEFLAPLKPDVNVTGNLGPFSIKLVGKYLDAVTILFNGARFTIKDGKSPNVDIFYKDFVIGKDLEYVQKLQSFLKPQKGSGFYLKMQSNPLGIEAGYGLAMPIISIGTVSFSNISLNASIIIPFDGSDTRFRASLSRVDAPFTIAAAPYGGSGFFGIEANGEGVIGFEASFEFGGAAAFNFGPLSGIGRLMVGAYIRQTKVQGRNLVDIMGTFYVGGTASIWIFNFGASLYVRLGMRGGAMTGEAIFTFSFSCGFVDFDYSITVQHSEAQMGTSAFFHAPMLRQVASATGEIGAPMGRRESPNLFNCTRKNATKCQGVDWKTYSSYFAEDPPTHRDYERAFP